MTPGLAEREIGTETYRILIADDDPDVRSYLKRMINDRKSPCQVEVLEAANENAALAVIRSTYVDLVLLDVYLDSDDPTGFELVSSLTRQGCCAKIVMMTHSAASRFLERTLRLVSANKQPRILNYLRTDELGLLLPDILRSCLAEFVERGVTTEGTDFVAGLIEKRRPRYPDGEENILRAHRSEIAVEVDRLCREVFGRTNGQPRSTSVRVRLERFDRRGLSAAILVRAVVTTWIGGSEVRPTNDFECVLKLGPVADIQSEVAHYDEYVRFGVQLKHRVELLESAGNQGIGAIAYSFAGGVHGLDLVSLDDLLRNGTKHASTVINDLFGSTNWYSVRAPEGPIREHIDNSSRTTVEMALRRNSESLANLDDVYDFVRFRGGRSVGNDSTLLVAGGPAFALPGLDFLNRGWHLRSFPRCLVHGDMHGGNVMVETGPPDKWSGDLQAVPEEVVKRICLIDYRSAGPGPRCLDAAALESSVRIAHSEELGGEAAKAGTLAGAELHDAMTRVVRFFDTEIMLYDSLFGNRRSPVPRADWCQLSKTIVTGLQKDFHEPVVSMEEYLQTALLYAVRQLAYDLTPIVRIRLCTWLAALYKLGQRVFPNMNGPE